MNKIQEKTGKLVKYIKLEFLFAKKSEFVTSHPKLKKGWKRKFRQMVRYSSERTFSILEEFLNAKIELIKTGTIEEADKYAPILICVLKDDLEKLHFFMEHYRRLGIKNFVFLDNGSTDGTFDFLCKQEDVTLYRCTHAYASNRKIAWLNRIMAEYGNDRWYLHVDSDEFFTFLGAKEHGFSDVMKKAEEKGYKRLGVVHLDMYPKGSLFSTDRKENFIEKYCYFDGDTYTFGRTPRGMKIAGGPRWRVFGTEMKVSGFRCVYFEEDDIMPSSHFMIPYEKSHDVPVCFVSRHYKFVNENDYEKMLEAVKTGKYANNSQEYKTYFKGISENPELSFYDEKHSLLFQEENLRKLGFVDDIFADDKR